MNKIFKEGSFLGKIEALFWKCYNNEPLRFIFWGGINTVITLINTMILNLIFSNVEWTTKILGRTIDLPFIVAFVIGIPIAYTTHTIFTFKQKWSFKRLLIFPLSSIPNFILQTGCIYIFGELCKLNINLTYFISAILPLPIMFFINKFLITPLKKKKNIDESQENQE